MKTRLLTAAALLAAAMCGQARTLTPAEALARLEGDGARMSAPARVKANPRLVYTASRTAGDAALYVFDGAKAGSGYMIVSADDCAAPLLGYSDSGSFDPASMPPQMEWWLEEYARQIEYMSSHGITASSPMRAERADRAPIAPQLKTDWDQIAPYNEQCPKYGANRCYTGCVATAMAQVMKYWNYPERGQGAISYQATSIQKRLSMDFSLKPFDWNNMLDTYIDNSWTDEQAAAVAYLMKACGYAVKMDYGTDSSGALAMNISRALVKYFNYDGNINYQLRSRYSLSQWEDLIYENLRDVGPILYGGGSFIGGGHSFVCDGYDGNGYFHFNWGWTGMSNGYFSLDALDPYSLGAGGGGGGGYNFTQDAVLGIQPPTGKPVIEKTMTLMQNGQLQARVAELDSLVFSLTGEADAMWVNYNPETLKLMFGALIKRVDKPSADVKAVEISDVKFKIEPGYGTSPAYFKAFVMLPELGLEDGIYSVTVATKLLETGSEEEWVPVDYAWGYDNSVKLTKAGSAYTVESSPVPQLNIASSTVVGGLYYGMANRFKITVANNSDIELSRGFAPAVIYNNAPVMLGESVMITVPPHSTVTHEWTTMLYLLDQNFSVKKSTLVDLAYFDETTYNFMMPGFNMPVVLQPNPGLPRVTTNGNPRIANATAVSETVNGNKLTVYEIEDPRDIKVEAPIRLVSGRFAYPVYACIAAPAQDDPTSIAIETFGGHVVFMDEKNNTADFSTSLSFPGIATSQIYTLMMAYEWGGQMAQMAPGVCYLRFGSSGVEDVTAGGVGLRLEGGIVSGEGLVEVYDTAGTLVASGDSQVDTGALVPGIYIARAGGSTLKIAIK